jgi:uncharacterized protein (TIGR02246 family)
MSVEDKFAIQEVIAQLSYTWDAGDAERFASLFTEDAVFAMFAAGATQPTVHVESQAAIRAWAVQRLQQRAAGSQGRHYPSGLLFDALSSEAAQTRTMLLLTQQHATEATPQLRRSGVFQSQWRKTPDGWKIVQYTLHYDDRR